MSQRDPEEILDIFDRMDLNEPEERRIALFTLNDYFGAVFAEVGDQLDFRPSVFSGQIGHQWNKASSRLEQVDSIEIPREYSEIPGIISGLRGDYAHNFRDYPPTDPIKSAREIAPEWAEWIRDASDEYEGYQESLTATEALVQVGERAFSDPLDHWRGYPDQFSGWARDLINRAEDLEEDLQSFRNDDEVTKELVEVISDIFEWKRNKKQFEEEVERLKNLDRAENTYNFIVVEEVDEFDSIFVVKNEIAEPDHDYTFTISNCPISEQEMDYLRDLDVNDEVKLWIGSTLYRDRNGRVESDDIIKEVVDMDTGSGTNADITDW